MPKSKGLESGDKNPCGGQRSWNYKEKSTWESRVPRMGAKNHAGVKGCWNYKQKFAWELKGLKIIGGNPHESPSS